MTLREKIRSCIRSHLESGYIAMGQCLSAVGWVGGTLPEMAEEEGMIELSMADVAGGGIAAGSALAGKKPIYIIRYQGFGWFNLPIILNYACKSREIWNRPSPMIIRSIAMEGGIGPVAGSSHYSLCYRMPGIKISAPISPLEYEKMYKNFMNNQDVLYVSEHRGTFNNDEEFEDELFENSDVTILGISITRLEMIEAAKILRQSGFIISVVHIVDIKPLVISERALETIQKSKFGFILLDDDYQNGSAKSIAFDVSSQTNTFGKVIGLEERSAGFSPNLDNLPPNRSQIVDTVKKLSKGVKA